MLLTNFPERHIFLSVKTKYRTLREYLDATGTTQAAFAERLGVGQAVISKVVNGRAPSFALAVRIAEAAQIPLISLAPSASSPRRVA